MGQSCKVRQYTEINWRQIELKIILAANVQFIH